MCLITRTKREHDFLREFRLDRSRGKKTALCTPARYRQLCSREDLPSLAVQNNRDEMHRDGCTVTSRIGASEFVHKTIVGLVSLAERGKSPASRNRDAG